MDPTELFEEAVEAMKGNDRETAVEALRDLADWLEKGGFYPVQGTVR